MIGDSVILRWLATAAVLFETAWQTSRARTLLARRALEPRSDAATIEWAGWALLAASLTHAGLLAVVTAYARPFYGPGGALIIAIGAVALIVMKDRLAAAWAAAAIRRRLRRLTSPDAASPPGRGSV